MIAGQIEAAEAMVPGYLTPNRRAMYAALQWCTTSYYQIAEEVRELLGAGPFQMPADISVVTDETLREAFETYWSVPGQSAIARMKLMKFAWDLLGSDFAGRHTQYEKFYAGPQFVNVAYSFLHCPWAEMRELVEDQLAQYDVPTGVRRPLAAQ
jgi:4-hydroxyphenylacetate 3-monooxygenase